MKSPFVASRNCEKLQQVGLIFPPISSYSKYNRTSKYTEQFLGYNFRWVSKKSRLQMSTKRNLQKVIPQNGTFNFWEKWSAHLMACFFHPPPKSDVLKVSSPFPKWSTGAGWKPWEMKGFCWGACCIPPWCMVIWKINATSTGAVHGTMGQKCVVSDVCFFNRPSVLFHETIMFVACLWLFVARRCNKVSLGVSGLENSTRQIRCGVAWTDGFAACDATRLPVELPRGWGAKIHENKSRKTHEIQRFLKMVGFFSLGDSS